MKLTKINRIFSEGCSTYEHDIIRILKNFKKEGTLVGNENRNSIKYFLIGGSNVNFKSFKQPNIFNRIVYKYVRKSKARRSFEYAHLLIERGFYTPQPIAFVESTFSDWHQAIMCANTLRKFYAQGSYWRHIIQG